VKICYYNRLLNEPWGAGVHGRSLVENWLELGHEVLCLTTQLLAVDPQARSGVRSLASLHPIVRAAAHEASARRRVATKAVRLAKAVIAFAPDMLVTRRAIYDYCLNDVLVRSTLPYVAEGNAIVSREAREFSREWVLPWEQSREIAYLRQAAGVVCVTNEVKAQLLAVGVPESRTAVLPNGVDVQRFSPSVPPDEKASEWSRRFQTVYCFAGSTRSSTHDLSGLLGVASELASQVAETGFLFVGRTLSEIQAEPAWRGNLDGRVYCTGLVAHPEVPSYLACADVFWASFRHDHGSPLKLYEYMAMAKPVILAGAGEAVEAVQSSRCGLTVVRGDHQGLLRCAVDMHHSSTDRRREMGASARAWITEGHTWADIAAKFVELGTAMIGQS
jgi:glycosyltransferase involved in cell wall biosynthesis